MSRRRQNVLTSPKIAIAFGPSRTFILNQFSRAGKLYIAARSVFPFCDNFCFRSDSLRLFMYIDVWRRTWTRNDTIWAFATPEWRRRRRRRNNIVSEAVKCYVFSSLCRRCVVAFGLIDDFIISAWKWRSGWSWITYTYCDLSSIQRKCNYGANDTSACALTHTLTAIYGLFSSLPTKRARNQIHSDSPISIHC